MRTIGKSGFQFPECREEALAWEPTRRWKALHHDVLVAATTRIEGTWKAYVGAVQGRNHDQEVQDVYANGGVVEEDIALAIFPEFKSIPYAG